MTGLGHHHVHVGVAAGILDVGYTPTEIAATKLLTGTGDRGGAGAAAGLDGL